MKALAYPFPFIVGMHKQRPYVMFSQVDYGKAHDTTIIVTNPSLASDRKEFLAVLVSHQFWPRQSVFLNCITDDLYPGNVLYGSITVDQTSWFKVLYMGASLIT